MRKFPTLIKSVREVKKKEKENRGERGEDKEREGFPAFRLSKLDGPRIKVDPCNESYVWVQKSEFFFKLQEVGVFSYSVYSLLKGHSMASWYSSKRRVGAMIVRNELWVI